MYLTMTFEQPPVTEGLSTSNARVGFGPLHLREDSLLVLRTSLIGMAIVRIEHMGQYIVFTVIFVV